MKDFLTQLENKLKGILLPQEFSWAPLDAALLTPHLVKIEIPDDIASLYVSLCGQGLESLAEEEFFQRRYRLHSMLDHAEIVKLAWRLLQAFYQNQKPVTDKLDQDIQSKLDFLVAEIYRQWELYLDEVYAETAQRCTNTYKDWLSQKVCSYPPAYSQAEEKKRAISYYSPSSPSLEYRHNRKIILAAIQSKDKKPEGVGILSKLKNALSNFFFPSYNKSAGEDLLHLMDNQDDPNICNLDTLQAWYKKHRSFGEWLFGGGPMGKDYSALKRKLKQQSRAPAKQDWVKSCTDIPKQLDGNKVFSSFQGNLTTEEFKQYFPDVKDFRDFINLLPNMNSLEILWQYKQFLPALMSRFPDRKQLFFFCNLYNHYEQILREMFKEPDGPEFMLKLVSYIEDLQKRRPKNNENSVYELYAQIANYEQHVKSKSITLYERGRLFEEARLRELLAKINKKIEKGEIDLNLNYKFRKKNPENNLEISLQFVPEKEGRNAYLKIHRKEAIAKGGFVKFRLAQCVPLEKDKDGNYRLADSLPYYVGRRAFKIGVKAENIPRKDDSSGSDDSAVPAPTVIIHDEKPEQDSKKCAEDGEKAKHLAQSDEKVEKEIFGSPTFAQERKHPEKGRKIEVEKPCHPGTNLLAYCPPKASLGPPKLWRIMHQILHQLQNLHTKYIHLDIKPDNIIYDDFSGNTQLVDTDLCYTKGVDWLGAGGTELYMHPIFQCNHMVTGLSQIAFPKIWRNFRKSYMVQIKLEPHLDLWSLGITLLKLIGCIGNNGCQHFLKDPSKEYLELHKFSMQLLGITSWKFFKETIWEKDFTRVDREDLLYFQESAKPKLSQIKEAAEGYKKILTTNRPQIQDLIHTTRKWAQQAPIPDLYQQLRMNYVPGYSN